MPNSELEMSGKEYVNGYQQRHPTIKPGEYGSTHANNILGQTPANQMLDNARRAKDLSQTQDLTDPNASRGNEAMKNLFRDIEEMQASEQNNHESHVIFPDETTRDSTA